ncbi:MAG: hypothetical protein U1F41_12450 [Burkholderiales bacterium]
MATLGNHEFDVSAFRAHLTQARLRIVSNVTDGSGTAFPGVASARRSSTSTSTDAPSASLKATIDSTKKDCSAIPDGIAVVQEEVAKLRGKVDAIAFVALPSTTTRIRRAAPGIDVILGGHEHENWLALRGPRFILIVKADANVRTIAIVTLTFGAPGTPPEVASRLVVVDDRIAADPAVDEVARAWVARGFDAFRKQGFAPEQVVAVVKVPLDGREATVRSRSSRLTDLHRWRRWRAMQGPSTSSSSTAAPCASTT